MKWRLHELKQGLGDSVREGGREVAGEGRQGAARWQAAQRAGADTQTPSLGKQGPDCSSGTRTSCPKCFFDLFMCPSLNASQEQLVT